MFTVFVKFSLAKYQHPSAIATDFSNISEMFYDIPGLVRKYFIIAEDRSYAGGIYLWESREAAETFYTDNFKLIIQERYGAIPEITFLNCPVVVDNQFCYEFRDAA